MLKTNNLPKRILLIIGIQIMESVFLKLSNSSWGMAAVPIRI